jgi:hypothetical protein
LQFYTKQHNFYCGVDLHADTMFVSILDAAGNIVVHQNLLGRPTRKGTWCCRKSTDFFAWQPSSCQPRLPAGLSLFGIPDQRRQRAASFLFVRRVFHPGSDVTPVPGLSQAGKDEPDHKKNRTADRKEDGGRTVGDLTVDEE